MYLTREEEKIYDGERGEALQKAIRAIVKVGEALGADRLIPIQHAHVSGISYYNIGEAGYKFIKYLYTSSVKTVVYSTLNPLGMDLDKWEELGINKDFASKQTELVNMLLGMGFEKSFTCTPYLLRQPKFREHLAWSESSAVGMANTYYGAYTNREAGPLALFSSLIGKTYNGGLHLIENRKPTVKVLLKEIEKEFVINEGVASAVGYIIGEKIGDGIPLIPLRLKPTFDVVKAYTAAAGAAGSIALSYLENVSPEYSLYANENLEKIEIDIKEIKDILVDALPTLNENDAYFIGCPHASVEEIINLYNNIHDCKKLKTNIVVSTSRMVYEAIEKMGIKEKLLNLGVVIIRDTCPIVSPAFQKRFEKVITSSGKALFYLPKQQSQPTILLKNINLRDILCRE
jgi:predicted aconitase